MLAISIVILLIMSFQVMPVAVGIDNGKMNLFNVVSGIFLLILGQTLLFLMGIWLGNRFMHLISGIHHIILFIGFFLIAIRLIMEAFAIRKGERTYLFEKASLFILPSVAQAINTFLAGVLFFFLPIDLTKDILYLSIFSLSFSVPFIFIKNDKHSLSAISLLYAIGGAFISILSFYFLFI